MKIRLFNFVKRTPNRNINCNPPIKNLSSMPNNLQTKKELTTEEVIARITERIIERIDDLTKKNNELLALLKRFS